MASLEHTLQAVSPSAAGTEASTAEVAGLGRYSHVTVDLDLQGATGGALEVWIQRRVGDEWRDWLKAASLDPGEERTRVTFVPSTDCKQTVVGADLEPKLSDDNPYAGGMPGDRVRFLFRAGGGTKKGAEQRAIFTGFRF